MEFTFEVHDDVHDMATTVGWAVSLVQLKEIQLNRGLVLGYNPTSYDRLEEVGSLDRGR